MNPVFHFHSRRRVALVAGWMLLVGVALAAEKSGVSAPRDWSMANASAVFESDGSIRVPAGSEITRRTVGETIQVRLSSRPYFSELPSDAQELAVGPASATFLRDPAGGAMILLGEEPVLLPFEIPLDQSGHSRDQIEFVLGWDRRDQTATLTINRQAFSVVAIQEAAEVSIVVAAGSKADWLITSLVVDATAPGNINAGPGGLDSNPRGNGTSGTGPLKAADRQAWLRSRKDAYAEASELFRKGEFTAGKNALMRQARHQPGTINWHIEAASKLTHASLALRQRYDYITSAMVAQQALAVLESSQRIAHLGDSRQRAILHEMTGFIHDEILRDRTAARSAYDRALKERPESPRAKKELVRLAEADAKSQRISGEK